MLGAAYNRLFLFACIALLVMGLIYNVPPLRLKDKAYFDVLTESINSPIRFLLGWLIVTANTLPPSSAILAYWMGGAFLMSVKRYAEYRWIGDPLRAERYRKSFARHTEESLAAVLVLYALCSAFFIAVFLIKLTGSSSSRHSRCSRYCSVGTGDRLRAQFGAQAPRSCIARRAS